MMNDKKDISFNTFIILLCSIFVVCAIIIKIIFTMVEGCIHVIKIHL
jgi:hypothetical protein